MSLQCPLCGKSRTDKSLFCPDCTVKLNSEYEVNLPKSENLEMNDDIKEQADKEYESDEIAAKERAETRKLNKKELKESAARTEKNYSYQSGSKASKKSRFIIISLLLFVLILIASVYIYNQHIKSDNLERSVWELVQRENSVDSYLSYIDEYPQGNYVVEAQNKMLALKHKESEAWENLKTSENRIEFTDFLQTYPQSPYKRMVKNRLDSLVWESSLKENSAQAYSEYLNMSNSGDISGQYIGEAQRRFSMLEQSASIDESDLEGIRETVSGFFTGLSNVSHTALSHYLAPNISRFNNSTNISSDKMIGQLLLLASKSDSKSIVYEPEITQLKYEKMPNGSYTVNVPIQKSFVKNNDATNQIKGYIVHLKLDTAYRIYSIYETKPFSTAP